METNVIDYNIFWTTPTQPDYFSLCDMAAAILFGKELHVSLQEPHPPSESLLEILGTLA